MLSSDERGNFKDAPIDFSFEDGKANCWAEEREGVWILEQLLHVTVILTGRNRCDADQTLMKGTPSSKK